MKDYAEMVYTLTDYASEGLCSDSLYTDYVVIVCTATDHTVKDYAVI